MKNPIITSWKKGWNIPNFTYICCWDISKKTKEADRITGYRY
jgi:hypothetical protein